MDYLEYITPEYEGVDRNKSVISDAGGHNYFGDLALKYPNSIGKVYNAIGDLHDLHRDNFFVSLIPTNPLEAAATPVALKGEKVLSTASKKGRQLAGGVYENTFGKTFGPTFSEYIELPNFRYDPKISTSLNLENLGKMVGEEFSYTLAALKEWLKASKFGRMYKEALLNESYAKFLKLLLK